MTNPSSPDLTAYRPQPGQQHPPGHAPQNGHRQPPRRRKRGMGFMGWIGLLLMAVIAVVVGALAVFVASPPTDLIRNQAIAQVKEKTGRDLTIAGPIGITVFPSLGVSLKDVALSGPPGMGDEPLTTMSDLNINVKLLPLLKKQVEVDTLVLTDPVFNLRINKQGLKSWDFARQKTPSRIRIANANATARDVITLAQADTEADASSPAGTSKNLPIDQLALGDVRIVNGTVNYIDETTGASQRLKKINVALGLKTIASPLSAKGNVNWKAETINFDGTLTSPKQILDQQPADVSIKLSAQKFNAKYNGNVSLADIMRLSGAITADVPSVRRLAGWLGTKLPPSRGFGALKLNGNLKAAGPRYALSKARLNMDGATATGDVAIQSGGKRPKIVADLKLSELNLNTYLSDGGGVPAAAKKPATTNKPESIDDLLAEPSQAPGTRVKGYTKRAGWSSEPIDLGALSLVDADTKLQVGRFLYKKIKVDSTNLAVKLNAGKLRADFTDVQLYGGRGRGVVTLEGTKTATVGANIEANNISALPLLTDAADVKFVEGNGNLKLAVAGRGKNQRSIINTLNGNGSFRFTDGALVGFNIPAAYRAITRGNITGLKSAPTEKTDFSAMTATFKIKKGIATNNDLQMLSPLLRLTGGGKIILPAQTVDYTVRPKVVGELQGQGGAADVGGVEIPVRITGTFDNLKYQPQLTDVFKDPNKAVDTIKKIGKKFKGKKAGEIVNDLLGNGANGDKKIDAKKLLDNLFN
ncbi:MAG: AsmA family protein [Hyphomicrobiaceae bacterium]